MSQNHRTRKLNTRSNIARKTTRVSRIKRDSTVAFYLSPDDDFVAHLLRHTQRATQF